MTTIFDGFELPDGWFLSQVTDCFEINPTNPEKIPSDCDEISFVPMSIVMAESGKIKKHEKRKWGAVKKGYKRFQNDDVIFAKITPCMENGKTAVVKKLHNGVGAGSTEFHVFRKKGVFLPKLLFFFFVQRSFRKSAKSKMTGTAGQLRVPVKFFDTLKLPIPPLQEQHRIVEAIESYLSRLDAAVANLERVRENLKRYRASVLKAAVEGRLVPTEAETARQENRDYEPADVLLQRILKERKERSIADTAEKSRAKAEARAKKANKPWTEKENQKALKKALEQATEKYKEPVSPDIDDLPELPEGWCWASPDQVISITKYSIGIGPFGSNLKVSDYCEDGVPLVFVRNIRSEDFKSNLKYVSNSKSHELDAHSIYPGDILITKMGDPPGDCCLYPKGSMKAIITADCIKLRINSIFDDAMFFVYMIRTNFVQKQIQDKTKGVAQKKISLARFRVTGIPVAPINEQYRIVQEVDRLNEVSSRVERLIVERKKSCQKLRQSILKSAFEGKLVDQDPTDEPASTLLERIKAEKAAKSKTQKTAKGGAGKRKKS